MSSFHKKTKPQTRSSHQFPSQSCFLSFLPFLQYDNAHYHVSYQRSLQINITADQRSGRGGRIGFGHRSSTTATILTDLKIMCNGMAMLKLRAQLLITLTAKNIVTMIPQFLEKKVFFEKNLHTKICSHRHFDLMIPCFTSTGQLFSSFQSCFQR